MFVLELFVLVEVVLSGRLESRSDKLQNDKANARTEKETKIFIKKSPSINQKTRYL
jgi:hypothetical protein